MKRIECLIKVYSLIFKSNIVVRISMSREVMILVDGALTKFKVYDYNLKHRMQCLSDVVVLKAW